MNAALNKWGLSHILKFANEDAVLKVGGKGYHETSLSSQPLVMGSFGDILREHNVSRSWWGVLVTFWENTMWAARDGEFWWHFERTQCEPLAMGSFSDILREHNVFFSVNVFIASLF